MSAENPFESQEARKITKEEVTQALMKKGLEDPEAVGILRSWRMQEEKIIDEATSNDLPSSERIIPKFNLLLEVAEIYALSGHEDMWRDTLEAAAEQAWQAHNDISYNMIRRKLDNSKLVIE